MQLRHISPRSSDWVDAMDEEAGGREWERLEPEELDKLRVGAQVAGTWDLRAQEAGGAEPEDSTRAEADAYGWRAGSASR
jgi:hypothetical protein